MCWFYESVFLTYLSVQNLNGFSKKNISLKKPTINNNTSVLDKIHEELWNFEYGGGNRCVSDNVSKPDFQISI